MTVKSRLLELLEQHKGETLSGEILAGSFPGTRACSLEGGEQFAAKKDTPLRPDRIRDICLQERVI